MPEKLDTKVYGLLRKTKNDQTIPDDEYIVFQVQDRALLPTLSFYWDECARLGAAQPQLDGVLRLIERVREWQAAHPERLKVPDRDPAKE